MKPLSINFLPPRPVSAWALVSCAVILAAALATSLGAWSTHGVANARLLQLEAAQRDRHAAEATAAVASKPTHVPVPYEAEARRTAQEAGFQAVQALAALEHVAMAGVTPVSVELQAESGLSRVGVEFSDPQVLLKYLEELNSGESALRRWQLLRATARSNEQAAGVAVLEAKW